MLRTETYEIDTSKALERVNTASKLAVNVVSVDMRSQSLD